MNNTKTGFHFVMIVFSLTLAFEIGAAQASPRGRQARQGARIQQGVRSGELTRGEARGLRQDQREVRQLRRDARSDGSVTREERGAVRDAQNEASKNIYQEKHDAETR